MSAVVVSEREREVRMRLAKNTLHQRRVDWFWHDFKIQERQSQDEVAKRQVRAQAPPWWPRGVCR